MLSRLTGFRLNQELAVKSNLLLVISCHLKESSEVVQLEFSVGVEERLVSFSASPENVSFPTYGKLE